MIIRIVEIEHINTCDNVLGLMLGITSVKKLLPNMKNDVFGLVVGYI